MWCSCKGLLVTWWFYSPTLPLLPTPPFPTPTYPPPSIWHFAARVYPLPAKRNLHFLHANSSWFLTVWWLMTGCEQRVSSDRQAWCDRQDRLWAWYVDLPPFYLPTLLGVVVVTEHPQVAVPGVPTVLAISIPASLSLPVLCLACYRAPGW